MTVEILLALLIGLLAGALASAKYLRQEIAANVGPRLRSIERQLDSLRAEINLAVETRLTAISKRIEENKPKD